MEISKFTIHLVFILLFVALGLSSYSTYEVITRNERTETLFTSNLNNATLKQTSSEVLLYSYQLPPDVKSGYFTVSVNSNSNPPNIGFNVLDQKGRQIMTGTPVPGGNITTINFQAKSTSTSADLYVSVNSPGIVLSSINVVYNK